MNTRAFLPSDAAILPQPSARSPWFLAYLSCVLYMQTNPNRQHFPVHTWSRLHFYLTFFNLIIYLEGWGWRSTIEHVCSIGQTLYSIHTTTKQSKMHVPECILSRRPPMGRHTVNMRHDDIALKYEHFKNVVSPLKKYNYMREYMLTSLI